MIVDVLPIAMLVALALLLFSGMPVAVLLTGLGVGFSLIGVLIGEMPAQALYNIPLRMFGSISGSLIYPAVVMLLFMGVALEKSGIARDLLTCLQLLLRRVPGGLAVAVIIIGVILAPAAGLVGASVVTLALIALPSMLARGYSAPAATGAVAAAGTVGIILPPAVMLFLLAGQFQVTIGAMFVATLVPGAILVGLYLIYYVGAGALRPPAAATDTDGLPRGVWAWTGLLLRGLVLPAGLVFAVLGSIIFAWATPPQSGAVGAAGGLVLMALNRRLTWPVFKDVVVTTTLLSAMVFFIIMAAAVFSYPFRWFGGDDVIRDGLAALSLGPWGTLAVIVGIIFVLGFFIDWIEITVITLPLFVPVLMTLDFSAHVGDPRITLVWMATLVALTLQTSFLTPPFGFALFFLKGAVPPGVTLLHIYRGIVPIVAAQLIGIGLLLAFPMLATWLPIEVFR
ncbi:MAG: TRAP transporter large permease subunit [Alphaproteobacteria bacterium]